MMSEVMHLRMPTFESRWSTSISHRARARPGDRISIRLAPEEPFGSCEVIDAGETDFDETRGDDVIASLTGATPGGLSQSVLRIREN